ncbi:MAG: hypothetical protein AB7V50_02960 [Vampirovibrionia bacterium]
MKTRSRIIKNTAGTIFLIASMIGIAYYLSNNSIFNSFIGSNKGINDISSNNIINHRYNKAIEGTVLDHIFNIQATVISLKEPKILHKKLSLSKNMFNSEDAKSISLSDKEYVDLKSIEYSQTSYKPLFSQNTSKYKDLLATINNSSEMLNREDSDKHVYYIKETRNSNRFEGIVEEYKSNETSKNKVKLISSIKNWDSKKKKPFTKLRKIFNLSYQKPNITGFDNKIIKTSNQNSKIKLNMVEDFSSDPLQSVIKNVLIPSGLPKTAANVDAIAKGMGLPSGAFGSSHALAGSLGITIEELSNPNTKLSTETILSINSNKNYIGEKLDINNTTLEDYYNKVIINGLSDNNSINEY